MNLAEERRETKAELIESIIKMNPKKESLTTEKLKMFKGFEDNTEEELQEYVQAIHQMAVIIAEHLSHQNGKVIELDNQNKLAA
ncbi:MAG: hypothetical protein RJA07_2715 [Bacteroidota bacterium]|jgi:adenylate kinase family enzyme